MGKKIKTFSIDLTRRCNLNCKYCYRGEAQNQDITHEIIDKTIEELSSFELIGTLMFMGGEPFICPDLIEYCVNKIVDSDLNFLSFLMYTNGTIKSEKALNALVRLKTYLEEKSPTLTNNFEVVVSVPMHDNADCIDEVIRFYAEGIGNASIFPQAEVAEFEENTALRIIEGLGEKNFHEMLSGECIPLRSVRRIHNKFHFLPHDSVLKTISVSTNGRIYVGASASYDRIDHGEVICNIQDCNGDLFDRILNFCWNHPISDKANNLKERCLTVKWCRQHGVNLDGIGEQLFSKYDLLSSLIDYQEQCAKTIHEQHPEFIFLEVELISCVQTMQYIKKHHLGDNVLEAFAKYATYFDDWKSQLNELDANNPYPFEWGRIYIEFALWRASERIRRGIDLFAAR